MFKILTAAVLSTMIAVVPATAQSDERRNNNGALAAFLLGGAAIIALSQSNKDKKKTNSSHSSRDVYRHTHGGSTHWHHRDEARHSSHRHNDRPQWDRPNRSNRYTLPSRCVRTIDTGRTNFRYVEKRCLKRADYDRRLPQACAVSEGRDGRPNAYGVRCLRKEGYRFDNNRFEARR
jgi:hypothetical protein